MRFQVYFSILLMLIAAIPSVGQGVPSNFQLDPQRLAKAKETEAEALLKKDSSLLAEAYYLYGKVYTNAANLTLGEEYFIRSLRILEPLGDSWETGRLYMRLSESDQRLRRYDSALQRAFKAEEIFKRAGSDKGLFSAYGNIGDLYWIKKDYPRATSYLKKAESIVTGLDDLQGMAETSHRLGKLLASQRSEEAFVYFEKAQKLFFDLKNVTNQTSNLFRTAEAYLYFDRYAEARRVLDKADSLYRTIHSPQTDLTVGLNEAFRKYFEKTRKWKEAYEYQKRRSEVEFERLGIQRDSVIRRLHVEYESERKDAALAAQQNEIKLQHYLNYLLLAVLCLTGVFTVFFYRLYRKNQKLGELNAHLVREQGHRIRNHLQMISNMLQLNSGILSDPEAKATLLESELRVQSIALLQKGIYSRDQGAEVFLPEYFTLLTDHVLEVSGYERVERQLEIEAIFLHPDRALPVALILNELVTNSCKYAFPGHPSPQLKVICRQEGERIHFMVADNGPGFSPVLPGSEQSFGMQLIRIQAEQLYAVYSFQNDPETGGALFEMEFSA